MINFLSFFFHKNHFIKKQKPSHLTRDEKAYFPWYHSSSSADSSANALIVSITGIPADIYTYTFIFLFRKVKNPVSFNTGTPRRVQSFHPLPCTIRQFSERFLTSTDPLHRFSHIRYLL